MAEGLGDLCVWMCVWERETVLCLELLHRFRSDLNVSLNLVSWTYSATRFSYIRVCFFLSRLHQGIFQGRNMIQIESSQSGYITAKAIRCIGFHRCTGLLVELAEIFFLFTFPQFTIACSCLEFCSWLVAFFPCVLLSCRYLFPWFALISSLFFNMN